MKRHHHLLSWPQLRDTQMQVACHFCDTLQKSPRLRDGEAAYCCHCGTMLYRNRPRSLAHATGFSAAALIFMAIAHAFPFLTMSRGSMSTRLTLLGAADALNQDGSPLLAVAVIFFTVISPLILVGGLFYVTAPLRHGIAAPGAIYIARLFQGLEPWSMLEVFLLGLIVSLLKLGKLADIAYNTGLWALVGLVICTAAAYGGMDKLELWDRLEISQQEKEEADAAPK